MKVLFENQAESVRELAENDADEIESPNENPNVVILVLRFANHQGTWRVRFGHGFEFDGGLRERAKQDDHYDKRQKSRHVSGTLFAFLRNRSETVVGI